LNIFWTNDELVRPELSIEAPLADLSLAYLPPEPLSKNIPTIIKDSPYIRCPAFTDTIRNTFVLKFPFSFKVSINLEDGGVESASPELTRRYVLPLVNNILQLKLSTLLFADKPCLVSQINPYLHSNSMTQQASILQGEFDIHKWFRPFNLALFVHPSKKKIIFDFKRGDVYSYIRFHTNENVKIYEFENTQEIQEITTRCLSLKFGKARGNMPLSEVYDAFLRKRYNKKLLNLLNENKIGEV